MALYSLPPASPRSDLNYLMFIGEQSFEEAALLHHRTLAPEWFHQSCVQLTWPHAETDWAYMLQEVTECYLRLAFEIAVRQPLIVVAPEPEPVEKLLHEQLPSRATKNIRLFRCPTNDTWARDHAFLTVVSTDGPELLDFRFNGWGGKFEARLDNAINARLAQTGVLKGKYVDCLDFELEGGSIETDGYGTLLTTSRCLENPNRNPQFNRKGIERLLADRLGVDHFLWIEHGYLAGDDTDSHVDTLARLCPNDTILYVQCADPDDEHYTELQAMEEELKAFRTRTGKPYRLIPLPMAATAYDGEERLPATYANYLVMNNAVLCPTYHTPELDSRALKAIGEAFPTREIVGIDCRPLIRQHGSLHCATMQFPVGVFEQQP